MMTKLEMRTAIVTTVLSDKAHRVLLKALARGAELRQSPAGTRWTVYSADDACNLALRIDLGITGPRSCSISLREYVDAEDDSQRWQHKRANLSAFEANAVLNKIVGYAG